MDVVRKQQSQNLPFLGYGLGLRPEYYQEILSTKPNIDWFEIITENYTIPGGRPLHYLDQIRQHYPIVMHGVSLSIGSSDAIDFEYLQTVKKLATRIEPVWISDHLCWTGVQDVNLHDLMPIPYTQEAIEYLVPRIEKIQEFLGRRILIENVSSYLTYKQSEMSEWEFVCEIVKRADCYILLDVNNVYVSSVNHEFNPMDYIKAMPKDRVIQIHLAGHSNNGDYIIDTHDAPIIQPVWDLYAKTIQHLGPRSTMVERDDNMPPFAQLLAEIAHAKHIAEQVLTEEVCV